MQGLMDRALSGQHTCCSCTHTATTRYCSQSGHQQKLYQRAASLVVSASARGRVQPSTVKKSGPKVKGKQSAKASPPQRKLERHSSSSNRQTNGPSNSVRQAAPPAPTRASLRLPRPGLLATQPPTGLKSNPPSSPAFTQAAPEVALDVLGGFGALSKSNNAADPATPIAEISFRGREVGDSSQDSEVEADGFLEEDRSTNDDEGSKVGQADVGDDGEEAFPEIRFNLPNPSNVKVKTAEYLQSCVDVSKCPVPRFPEFAVVGRSNVGKSSLINMMTGRKELALVSKQPGKTKCINHFLINGSWYLVDLPGYGFAKVGLEGRQQFDSFTREYFKARPNLAMVFTLVDASIPPQKIDLDYVNWLTDNEVPFTLVFTKADKRRKGVSVSARDSNVTAFKRALLKDLAYLPPSILTSSAKGLGRSEMLNFIAGLRLAFERSGRLFAIRQGML